MKPSYASAVRDFFRIDEGVPKVEAVLLFDKRAASAPPGKLRAELIPDSSWKRAGERLGPQSSQTVARIRHVLAMATRIWEDEAEATGWLTHPHAELQWATPLSLLRTEAGGRAIEALLAALEFGFPV
jgi:putative toxin-antitoxin system antitoxin component (TIGR02293 family)